MCQSIEVKYQGTVPSYHDQTLADCDFDGLFFLK